MKEQGCLLSFEECRGVNHVRGGIETRHRLDLRNDRVTASRHGSVSTNAVAPAHPGGTVTLRHSQSLSFLVVVNPQVFVYVCFIAANDSIYSSVIQIRDLIPHRPGVTNRTEELVHGVRDSFRFGLLS